MRKQQVYKKILLIVCFCVAVSGCSAFASENPATASPRQETNLSSDITRSEGTVSEKDKEVDHSDSIENYSEDSSREEVQPIAPVKKQDINLDGKPLSYEYVNSVYYNKGITTTLREPVKLSRSFIVGQNSYLTQLDNGWFIKGQTWTEPGVSREWLMYANTTGMNFNLPDGDYEVTVTYTNPENETYKVAAWDKRGRQTQIKSVTPGKKTIQKFRVSVIDNNLKLFFIHENTAYNPEQGWGKVYIQNIELKTMEKRKKGVVPTIYITGDSTAHTRDASVYPREGWGQEFYRCLDNGKLRYKKDCWDDNEFTPYTEYGMKSATIKNWAYSGESTGSFWYRGKFDNILNEIKPGDYVLVQFGHNDASTKKVSVYTSESEYRNNLMTFATGCQQRGAKCIFISPTPKCKFVGSKLKATLPTYKSAMKSAASKTGSVFVDTGKAVENYMNSVDVHKAKSYYMLLSPGQYPNYPNGYHDSSHYNYTGAKKAAQIIGITLKENEKVPKKLTQNIKISSDYYEGVSVILDKVKVSKSKVAAGKSTKKSVNKKSKKSKKTKTTKKTVEVYKLNWKRNKYAKYYVVYQYIPSTNSYKKIATTRKTSYTLTKGYTKKQASHMRIKAVLSRFNHL